MRKINLLIEIINYFFRGVYFFTNSRRLLSIKYIFSFIKPIPNGYNSQSGQDKIAEDLLINLNIIKNKLKIVDIGSNHPIVINNTYYFEKNRNAEVFSIEPNPEFIPLYKKHKRDLISHGVGNVKEKSTLFVPKKNNDCKYGSHVYGTFNLSKINDSNKENIITYMVNIFPLSYLIEKGEYDILFIDVEGFEEDVLNGIDFELFSFNLIFIENNCNLRKPYVLRKFLFQKGYKLYGRIHNLDDIFIKKI